MKIFEFEKGGGTGALSEDGQLFLAGIKKLTPEQRTAIYVEQYGEGYEIVKINGDDPMNNTEFTAAYSRRLDGASVQRAKGGAA